MRCRRMGKYPRDKKEFQTRVCNLQIYMLTRLIKRLDFGTPEELLQYIQQQILQCRATANHPADVKNTGKGTVRPDEMKTILLGNADMFIKMNDVVRDEFGL